MTTQLVNGKAFEYSLLQAFYTRLKDSTSVEIIKAGSYHQAKECYEMLDDKARSLDDLTASFAVNFLLDIEPRLSWGIGATDCLQLEIVSDQRGQAGDVRDVLAIRLQQGWEIGISAKNNHRAVKHPRLSAELDFGEKWIGLPCSSRYFEDITPIFSILRNRQKDSKATAKWEELGDYHKTIYRPILSSFREELLRLNSLNPKLVASQLVMFLIGTQDFYKVIKLKDKVEIQAYNLSVSLNQPIGKHKPEAQVPRLKLPNKIIDIFFTDGLDTTLQVILDEGWQLSFRIHNASSRIEPSLKFDINLISHPYTLFVNQLFLP